MPYNFITKDRNQAYLMPPNVKDWLPENHLAWFLLDAIDQMDISRFYRKYRKDGHGRAAYEPSIMVSLLLYSYSVGERSSRRIEQMCAQDVAFRVVAANHQPDYSTICRFRKDNEKEIAKLFEQVLSLCDQAGLIEVGVVALDGTKIKANAALDANRTHSHIQEIVEKMLREADAKDEEEDRLFGKDKRGNELPVELVDRTKRLARLKECQERLEKEAEEKAAKQQEKIEKRKAQEEKSGRKKRGRKPKEPDPTPSPEAKANITDPDSRILKTRKGFIQGYNGQAIVTKDQIILAAELTQEENDVHQLHPMLETAQRNLDRLEGEHEIKTVLADAGYCSEDNLKQANPQGPELLVATTKDYKQRQACKNEPLPDEPISDKPTQVEQMEGKLRTEEGRALYKLRGQTVEPVFGQIKDVRDCDGFMRRGTHACDSEWKLICLTHNILKLWRRGVRAARKIKQQAIMDGKVTIPVLA